MAMEIWNFGMNFEWRKRTIRLISISSVKRKIIKIQRKKIYIDIIDTI